MQPIEDLTTLLIQKALTEVVVSVKSQIIERLISYIKEAKQNPTLHKKLLKILWIVSIVLMLATTTGLTLGIYAITNSYKIGIYASVILWAIFFGVTILWFLPSKLILPIFGFLLGGSVSEIGNSAGLITKVNETVTNISNQIGIIITGTEEKTDLFISQSVWTFFIIVILLCLPAFFEKPDTGKSKEDPVTPIHQDVTVD